MASQDPQAVRRNAPEPQSITFSLPGRPPDHDKVIELAYPSGRRLCNGDLSGRFLGSTLSAISKEHGNLPGPELADLVQRVVAIAASVYPDISLSGSKQSLLSAVGEHLPMAAPAPDVPGQQSQYHKLNTDKLTFGEHIITIQVVRQQVIPSWLNAPFPTGEINPIPDSLYSSNHAERLQEALSWEVPLFAQLALPDGSPDQDSPIGSMIRQGHWFTDAEMRVVIASLAPSAWLKQAYTFTSVRSNPVPALKSPLAALSSAWGLFLETQYLSRCVTAIVNGTSSSDGAWLKSQSTLWALRLMEDLKDVAGRILGFGSGRLHIALPSADTGALAATAAAALSHKAFAYTQDGAIHVPEDFEAAGPTNVYVELLMTRETGKLTFADKEIQKVLHHTTIGDRMGPYDD